MAASVAIAAQLGACGQVQVRQWATDSPERHAFALAGPSIDELHDRARQLCPGGADVLRSSRRLDGAQVGRPAGNWYSRWWQAGQSALAPASGQAQLMVVCQPVAGFSTLAAMPPPVATAATAPATNDVASDAGGIASGGRPNGAPGPNTGPSLAPVGEGDLRSGVVQPMTRQTDGQPAPRPQPSVAADRSPERHVDKTSDLRAGMTAALPTDAVSSGRAGRAPSAAGAPARSGSPATPGAAPAPGRAASRPPAPVLTY
jgi:hypothetical protein